MNLRDILSLYDYNYWANHRILAASAGVSRQQLTLATTHSFGSLHGTLVHTLDTEYSWRILLQHNTLDFRALEEEDFPTFDTLQQRWQEEELAMRDFLVHLTDAALTGMIRYTTDEGDKRERILWHCLLHVVNHGTHHRSEAAGILTDDGHSPGDLDFTVFLNEQ